MKNRAKIGGFCAFFLLTSNHHGFMILFQTHRYENVVTDAARRIDSHVE